MLQKTLADAVTQFMVSERLRANTLPPPKDGRAYKAWLVGGYGKLSAKWRDRFLETWGIHIADHWPMENQSLPVSTPVRTELVIIVTDLGPHGLTDRAAELARRWNIPFVRLRRGASAEWTGILGRAGFPSPPPWRKPPPQPEPAPRLTVVRPPPPPPPQPEPTPVVLPEPEPKHPEDQPMATSTPPTTNRGVNRKRTPKAGFAASLRALRERVGLSQREMAELCGTSQTNISHWEIGIPPGYEGFERIASALPEIMEFPEPKPGFHERYAKAKAHPPRKESKTAPPPAPKTAPPQPEPVPPTVTPMAQPIVPTPTPPPSSDGLADVALRYAEAVQNVARLTRALESAKITMRILHEELEKAAADAEVH